MDIFSFSLLFSIKTRSSASTGVPVRTDGQTPVARYSAAGRAQTRCFSPHSFHIPPALLNPRRSPKSRWGWEQKPLAPPNCAAGGAPAQDARRTGVGRGGLGGPFPSPKRPFSGLAHLPPKQHLPAYPWLALSVRGAAGMGAQGRGRAVPSRAVRDALRRAAAAARPVPGSARLGRGEGRGCPRLPAPPGGPGTAPHGTARGTAERSSAAPRPPGTAAVPRQGLGAPVATPEAEGGSLLFLSPAGLLLRSFVVRVSDTTQFP